MLYNPFHINGYALFCCIFRHCLEIKHTEIFQILSNYKKLNYNISRTLTQNEDSVNETITHNI
ncbi:hypothetical protein YYG_05046 [Plasmodium vinckei petteri]|uniref:Uncharacterized protein n=1 Tax=Plasmodium vinckei petteri TaxID=138298 RepID=W7ADA2_PLAVN|nr:hypothetical protein YYG_05046 [Plasmodium vinckei petteri]